MSNPTVLLTLRTALYLQQTGHVHIKGRLLDAGCGSKPYFRLFHSLVDEWVGLDARPVGDVEGYIEQNDLESDSFDTVLCTNVIQFCPDPQIAVAELARVLKPGGHLILTVPCMVSDDGVSRYAFSPMCATELVKRAGLTITDTSVTTGRFADEFESFQAWGRYSVPIPKELHGWVGHLDKTYPLMSAIIAEKPCESPSSGTATHGE